MGPGRGAADARPRRLPDHRGIPRAASLRRQRIYRPTADGSGYGTPESLTPGFCTLSALFSDWDRSGRRDLRVTNDRQYYLDGEDQLWRIEPGQAPVAWTREEGWPKLQVWGMGLASDDLTGDGSPEVYVTSFADNKLQSLPDGAIGPAYENIAGDLGVGIAQPAAGGEHLPSTSWHAEFDDVNNDGHLDLFVAKGNVEAMAENAMKDPSELLVAQRDGSFRRVAKAAGILDFERSRGAALADLNLDGLLDLVEVKRDAPVRILRNVGAGSAARPRSMGHWLGIELSQSGPNVDAIGSWIEVDRGDGRAVREVTVGGGHAGGQLGPDALRPGIRETGPRPRDLAGRRGRRVAGRGRGRSDPDRARQRRAHRPPGPGTRGVTSARLAEVELPDFGMPTAMPILSAAIYEARIERARARAVERAYDHLVVYADREHSANLSHLSRVRPAFRGGDPHPGPGRRSAPAGRQRVPGHGPAGAADHARGAVPGPQPARPATRPLARASRTSSARRASAPAGGWVSSAGRPTPTEAGWRCPSFLADALRVAVGASGSVENANDLFIDPASGLRTTNEVEQLAAFEYAACHTSEGVKRLLYRPAAWDVRAGGRDSSWAGTGLPSRATSCSRADPRASLGLLSPTDRRIERGDRFTTAFGIWGALDCRAGFVVEDASELPSGICGLRGAARGPLLHRHRRVAHGAARRPDRRDAAGHHRPTPGRPLLRHLPEPGPPHRPRRVGPLPGVARIARPPCARAWPSRWTSSRRQARSTSRRTSRAGWRSPTRSCASSLAARFPEAWRRIEARREFMRDALGIRLHPDVLPFSNLPAYLPPFLLRPQRAMSLA